jgi:hypothetical protein
LPDEHEWKQCDCFACQGKKLPEPKELKKPIYFGSSVWISSEPIFIGRFPCWSDLTWNEGEPYDITFRCGRCGERITIRSELALHERVQTLNAGMGCDYYLVKNVMES